MQTELSNTDKATQKVWKVEYHNSEEDWRKGIFTTKVFYDFKEAGDFTYSCIGWHMGPVRIIHPD